MLLLNLLLCLLILSEADAQVSVSVNVIDGPIFGEADFNATISVALNGRPDNDNSIYTIQINTEDASATAEEDFEGLNEELIFSPNISTQDVTLRILDDSAVEPIEFFTIIITTNSSQFASSSTNTFVIIEDDQDVVSIAFQNESYTTTENTPAIVCVEIVEGTIERSVDFDIIFSAITASPIDDYSQGDLTGSMSINPNETRVCIPVPILPDSLVEDTESFMMSITGGADVMVVSPGSTIVYITDLNGGIVRVVNPTEPLLSPLFVIIESDSNQNVSFCLELFNGGPLERDLVVRVDVSVSNGTASESTDFIPVSGLILIIPVSSMNGATVCSYFTVLGDVFIEGTEFFSIIVTPNNTLDRADNNGTVFIVNDDQVIECPDLQSPSNGDVTVRTLEGMNHVQVANYTCDQGYVLNTHQFERVCLINGNWSGYDPECKLVNCGNLTDPLMGQVDVDGTVFGSYANYSCEEGYVVDGVSSRVCQGDGEWSGNDPNCVPANCSALDDPVNGFAFETAFIILPVSPVGPRRVTLYFCDLGYNLVGDSVRRCQSNETWSGSEPSCEIVDCGPLDTPTNGQVLLNSTVFESVAYYICNEGYTASGGNQTRSCLAEGSWSGLPQICIGIDCGTPPIPVNGQGLVIGGTRFDTGIVVYTCDEGHTLVGTANQTCEADGMWSANLPLCDPIQCESLESPVNGIVEFNTPPVFQTQAMYTCNVGYTLIDNNVRRCLANGEWSGVEPSCEVKDCGSLQDPDNGQVLFSSTTFGSEAQYTCSSGYRLTGGPVNRTCSSTGEWSNLAPECILVDCGMLPVPVGVIAAQNGTTFGSVIEYTCTSGLTLVNNGSGIRVCEADGQWTGSEPVCQTIAIPTTEGINPREDTVSITEIAVSVSVGGVFLAVIITAVIILVAVKKSMRKASYTFGENKRSTRFYENHPVTIGNMTSYGENDVNSRDHSLMDFTLAENMIPGTLTFQNHNTDTTSISNLD